VPPTQAPDVHVAPAAQRLSQRPQFVALVIRSAQLTPHWVRPAAHELEQDPREHTWPDPQALPQEPQFKASDPVSTQLPAQSARPTAQPGSP